MAKNGNSNLALIVLFVMPEPSFSHIAAKISTHCLVILSLVAAICNVSTSPVVFVTVMVNSYDDEDDDGCSGSV